MLRSSTRKKLLVVGQTPPPHHGQAIMIKYLVDGQYEAVEIKHVLMRFSGAMGDVGRFQLRKLLALPTLIMQIVYWRMRGYQNLYYPPASGNLIPILRDIVVLGFTRFLFKRVIFHFHTADLTSAYQRIPTWLKPLYRLVYFRADLGMLVAKNSGVDPDFLQCKSAIVIPNAVADQGHVDRADRTEAAPTILYVGAVSREKGLMDLLEAARQLAEKDVPFQVSIVGEFRDEEFKADFLECMKKYGLKDQVDLVGLVSCDQRKREVYQAADIFCFPTYYSAETFGIVVIEAMSTGLPVVATNWRGIPETVQDGTTGLLVETRDTTALAERLERLLTDRAMRISLGQSGRDRYVKKYTLEVYRNSLESALDEVCI